MKKKKTQKAYQKYLNSIGVPNDDRKSEGGRIPDFAKYGNWLRKNDPIAFCVGYQEFKTQ